MQAASRWPNLQSAASAVSSAGQGVLSSLQSAVGGAAGQVRSADPDAPVGAQEPDGNAWLHSLSIDQLTDRELDLLTTPEPSL